MYQAFNKSQEDNVSAESLGNVEEEQKRKIYTNMSAEQKFKIAAELYYSALALKKHICSG